MGDFAFGNYYQADSTIHKLDPRVKLSLLMLIMTAVFITVDFLGLLFSAVLVLTSWLLARIPLAIVSRSVKPLLLLMMLPVSMNIFFTTEGYEVVSFGIVRVTDYGIQQGVFTGCRLFLLLSCGLLLTLTTTSLAIAYAIGEMLKPFERFGLPAYEISLMMRIALRNVSDVALSLNQIRKAQQARGVVFDSGDFIKRIKALVPCMVPLFARCFRNAEYLGMAMDSRCHHGSKNRSYYRIYQVGKSDAVALVLSIILLAVSICLRIVI